MFGDDFVNTAQTGDIVLVERKCLFEHRRVSSDVLRGVAGTVSHHFLPKRTSVEPWTDVGLVVEIVLPALNNQRCAVKSVVSIDDNGAIFIRSLIQFVGEVHADASTCALRRLSCVVPCPDPASGGQGPERSHARARSNSHPSRVAADIPSAGSKLSPIPISASPNHSSEPVRSRITVMSKLTAFIQAIVDFTMRTSHAFKINASYPTALPIHLSYHDLMLASSVASCRPCIGALDAAARRAGRTSKYPSVDDVNNLIQIFFTIDRDQIGSVPIGIVREFVDPTMRAAGGAGEMMRPRGAMVRSREEIEARLREMDINEDGVISLVRSLIPLYGCRVMLTYCTFAISPSCSRRSSCTRSFERCAAPQTHPWPRAPRWSTEARPWGICGACCRLSLSPRCSSRPAASIFDPAATIPRLVPLRK